MRILGYTIIKTDDLIQIELDKYDAQIQLEHRPTRDDLFKFGEEMAQGCSAPYKQEITFLQGLLQDQHKINTELREKLKQHEDKLIT